MASANPLQAAADSNGIDFTLVVVDADAANGQEMRLRQLVHELQLATLNVLLVSRSPIDSGFYRADANVPIDGSRVTHMQARWEDPVVDVLFTAREFQCPFVTNADIEGFESSFKVSRKLRSWLQAVRRDLTIRFTPSQQGGVLLTWPQMLRDRVPAVAERAAALRSAAWLAEGEAAAVPASQRESALRPAGPTASPLRSGTRVPPPPPMQTLPSAVSGGGGGADMWGASRDAGSANSAVPPMWAIAVQNGQGTGYSVTLVVECENQAVSSGIFPYSNDLVGYITNCSEQIGEETCGDNVNLVQMALDAHGLGQWSEGLFCVSSVLEGRWKGLRAVGLGSNKKCRGRASKIALAALWRAKSQMSAASGSDDHDLDVDSQGTFQAIVAEARRLLSAYAPEGGAASAANAGDDESWWRGRSASEFLQGAPNGTAGHASAAPAAELNITKGSVVVASSVYRKEGDGYLDMRKGDRIKCLFDNIEIGGPQDHFTSYAFGESLIDQDAPSGKQGWFPLDLVRRP
eukprot:TRINITY_DN19456_c0_g2_i1.p1 TRINITY_DN19456_c0_g2~~TRINITY_DN19456_c0_g2_i1.p1  ORF type:complete len:532 (+),score=109.50 TRINITY_DN19456_c0_g2_i1:41-1597(+)